MGIRLSMSDLLRGDSFDYRQIWVPHICDIDRGDKEADIKLVQEYLAKL